MKKRNINLEKENSDFIKEVVKEKRNFKNKIWFKILLCFAIVAIAAIIAAFVFAFTLPIAKNIAGTSDTESNEKISINDEQDDSSEDSVSDLSNSTSDENISSQPIVIDPAFTLTDYENLYNDINDVATGVKKSMVKVTAITSQTDYFEQTVEDEQSMSGVVVGSNDSSYFILSNYSILENVERIQIEFLNAKTVNGELLKYDAETDIAVIKVNRADLDEETLHQINTVSFGNSLGVKQGNPIIALSSRNSAGDYMSCGMISSITDILNVYDSSYSIFDTNISNSKIENGILINLSGEIIGIIRKSKDTNDSTVSAYAISQIKYVIEKLSNNETRAFLGIMATDVSSDLSEKTGIPNGIMVTDVKADSPAMLSGIMENDVIISLDEHDTPTMLAFQNIMRQYNSGDETEVHVMRKGVQGYTEVEFNIQLGEV